MTHIRRIRALCLAFSFLSVITAATFCASAQDRAPETILNEALQTEATAWKFKLDLDYPVDSEQLFRKALRLYDEYITSNPADIFQVEKRGFNPIKAIMRKARILRFGLGDEKQFRIARSELINAFSLLNTPISSPSIKGRLNSRLKTYLEEIDRKGYLKRISDETAEIVLIPPLNDNTDIIIRQYGIPVARVTPLEVRKTTENQIVVKGEVVGRNPLIRILPLNSADAAADSGYKKDIAKSQKYYSEATELFENYELFKAKAPLHMALAFNPEDTTALNMMGFIEFNEHEILDAKRLFIRALETNPAYIEAFLGIASVLYADHNYYPLPSNTTIDILRQIAKSYPSYLRANYWLGHALDDLLLFEPARLSYKTAQKTTPVLTIDRWYKRTSLELKMKIPGQSLWDTAFDYLNKKSPMFLTAYFLLKESLLLNQGDKKQRDFFRKADEVYARLKSLNSIPEYALYLKYMAAGNAASEKSLVDEAADNFRAALFVDQYISQKFISLIRPLLTDSSKRLACKR